MFLYIVSYGLQEPSLFITFQEKKSMVGTDHKISSPLQKLRLKYYWQGAIMHDMVSLVGEHNIMDGTNSMRKSSFPTEKNFYYVTRRSINNGKMDYLSTPIKSSCTSLYFKKYLLSSSCIVISGDSHQFSAMLIPDSEGSLPIVLGRESYAIRFNTPEDAVIAHAWLLSDEVSSAIRATLKERSTMMNKHSVRLSIDDLRHIPVPSLNWLANNQTQGVLKAKCIDLGSQIITSLQGACANDPIYESIFEVLESTAIRLGHHGSA